MSNNCLNILLKLSRSIITVIMYPGNGRIFVVVIISQVVNATLTVHVQYLCSSPRSRHSWETWSVNICCRQGFLIRLITPHFSMSPTEMAEFPFEPIPPRCSLTISLLTLPPLFPVNLLGGTLVNMSVQIKLLRLHLGIFIDLNWKINFSVLNHLAVFNFSVDQVPKNFLFRTLVVESRNKIYKM